MKPFQIIPSITEYDRFASFAAQAGLGKDDLILTNEYIYAPVVEALDLGCQTLFQEQFGAGEPTDTMVNGILDALRGAQYHRIVAIGGGTIIDIAKVLAVAGGQDRVDDLYDRMDRLVKIHPLTVVPTTCGTGSEVTNISIINRTAKGIKQGLVCTAMFADEVALIPEMLISLPYPVYATSSIDAMIHAVESFLSPNACSLSEVFSEKALEQILAAWRRAVAAGDQNAWKTDAATLLRASNWAGIAFGYAGCAAVHALSYPLGGVHHIPHGQANQLMFSSVMRKYQSKKPEGKLQRLQALLASVLDTQPENTLPALYSLMDAVLERRPLREHGVSREELPGFAENVVKTQQRLLNNNYVELSTAEILEIYQAAF